MDATHEVIINIGRDFSQSLGGRFKKLGPFSGEEFYEKILLPKYEEALNYNVKLHIYMDDILYTYPSSFIDQSFGQLGRIKEIQDVKSRVVFHTQKYNLVVETIMKLWDE